MLTVSHLVTLYGLPLRPLFVVKVVRAVALCLRCSLSITRLKYMCWVDQQFFYACTVACTAHNHVWVEVSDVSGNTATPKGVAS